MSGPGLVSMYPPTALMTYRARTVGFPATVSSQWLRSSFQRSAVTALSPRKCLRKPMWSTTDRW